MPATVEFGDMISRWPYAAPSSSLCDGWHPVSPFPACAAVCFVRFLTRQRRQPLAPLALNGYAWDRRARPSEMKKRWSNAARFVSLTHGWPEYDYPAYAAVELALACASAAPPAAFPAPAYRLPAERVSLCPRRP